MSERGEREKIQLVRDLIKEGGEIESVSSEYSDDGGVLDVLSCAVRFTRLNLGPTVKIKFSCGAEFIISNVSESGIADLKEIIEGIYLREGKDMGKYRSVKIRVNPENSAEVQQRLFDDGCIWCDRTNYPQQTESKYLYVNDMGYMNQGITERYFDGHGYKEITAQQILDPFHDIKQAWANGETLQFKIFDEWMDWIGKDDLALCVGTGWRVKPKTKTIKQWERKYMSKKGFVVTVQSAKRPVWHENWLGDAYQAEYEVPND